MRGAARGGRAKALRGLPGPAARGRRSHFEFRYRQSWQRTLARASIWTSCATAAQATRAAARRPRAIFGLLGGCLAFPSKARRRLHKKYAEGGGLLSVEGEIIYASARECSFFCVATDVSRRLVLGLLSPKEHGLLKKAAPCKICGFSSPNFVPTRREDSSLVINTSRSRTTRSIEQKVARPQPRRRKRRTYRSRASKLL